MIINGFERSIRQVKFETRLNAFNVQQLGVLLNERKFEVVIQKKGRNPLDVNFNGLHLIMLT